MRKRLFIKWISIVGMVFSLGLMGFGGAICAADKIGGSITVDYMAAGTYDLAAKELAPQFEKITGTKVKIVAYPWAVLREKNMMDLMTGTGAYDVVNGGYYLAKIFSHFVPLDDYIKRDAYGVNMIPGSMRNCDHYRGHQIAVPYGIDAYSILYRRDLFAKAGLTIPGNWGDIVVAAQKLNEMFKEDGINGYVFSAGAIEQLPTLLFAKYNGTLITVDNKFHLDRAEAVKAFKTIKEILKYAPSDVLGLSIDEANAVFLGGRAGMIECWPSFIRASAYDPARSKIVGKWGIFPYPKVGFPWLSLWQMYLSEYSKNKKAGWEWMKFYTSEKFAKHFFVKYGIGSMYPSTYRDPELMRTYKYEFPGLLANFERAKNPSLSGEAQDFLASTIGEMLMGKLTPEQTVEKVNAKWATLEVPEAITEMGEMNGLKAK